MDARRTGGGRRQGGGCRRSSGWRALRALGELEGVVAALCLSPTSGRGVRERSPFCGGSGHGSGGGRWSWLGACSHGHRARGRRTWRPPRHGDPCAAGGCCIFPGGAVVRPRFGASGGPTAGLTFYGMVVCALGGWIRFDPACGDLNLTMCSGGVAMVLCGGADQLTTSLNRSSGVCQINLGRKPCSIWSRQRRRPCAPLTS